MAAASKKIPSSLRCVAPFLEEAQVIMFGNRNESIDREPHTEAEKENNLKKMRIAICCLDHAIHLVNQFALKLDEEAKVALADFKAHRNRLSQTLDENDEFLSEGRKPGPLVKPVGQTEKLAAEDALLAEANAILDLAERQLHAKHNQAAARNFHTASVYYRILQSIAPKLTPEVKGKMQYAACRTQLCSGLIENFVHEHLEGRVCADYYDIIGETGGGRLGEGSYGAVHLCKCKRTGDSFAVKVIGLNRINSHYLRKLHLEIAIMKEVDHPNIIRIHEVFFGSRTVYLIMELCKGGELFAQLTNMFKRGFPETHAALLMRDMVSSIKYLHMRGIVHRDVKLENFLFEQTTTDSRLKLIDFGLSKHSEEHATMHQVVGSAYYTAPEVLRGDYDHRCDIWSLGVVAYMLVSGSPPFFGSSTEEIHLMIETVEVSFPPKRFGHLSEPAVDFVRKLLIKDVKKRITLEEALEHPFIKSADNYVASEAQQSVSLKRKSHISAPTSEVVTSLGHFLQADRVKKFVLEAVAFSLTPTQMSDLADDFYSIDTHRNGVITMGDLQRSITTASSHDSSVPSFESLGVDLEHEVNFSEFIAAAMSKRITIDEDRLAAAFTTLDESGTGFLDYSTIRNILGTDATDMEVAKVISDLDTNHDGKIDYNEFSKYWRDMQMSQKVLAQKKLTKVINKVTTTMGVLGRFTKGVKDASAATGDLLKAATGLSLDNGGHKKSGSSFLSSGGSASKLPPLTPIKNSSQISSVVEEGSQAEVDRIDSKVKGRDSKRSGQVESKRRAGEDAKKGVSANVIALPSLHANNPNSEVKDQVMGKFPSKEVPTETKKLLGNNT